MSEYEEFDDLDDAFDTIIMTGDNGEELEFVVIDSVEMEGYTYLLLIHSEDMDEEEPEAFIFKQVENSDEDAVFEEPSEEEFEKVSKLFRDASEDFQIE